MSEESQILVASSSGIQTVPQLAAPQLVYLDFDGAETSYVNCDLDIAIDNIVVEESGFDSETISLIVATLNEQFGDDIVFTADIPVSDEYSTIYIGVTSAFEEYGDFLGLAETIDSGNQIHDDNAFVMLNSTASLDLVTSVITHETEHLVGTLDHGGNGMERYAGGYIYYYYLYNQTYTGELSGDLYLFRNSTGKEVYSSRFQSDGEDISSCTNTFYVSANNVTLNRGDIEVDIGGRANHTTLNGGGVQVNNGGVANNTTVNSGGVFAVGNGGVANGMTVNSGGSVWVASGGTANAIKENGGYVEVSEKNVSFIINIINNIYMTNGMTLHSGTTANSTTVNSHGSVFVSNGGVANGTTVNSLGSVFVFNGGVANGTTVNSLGSVSVFNGGVANGMTVNSGGSVWVASGGTMNNTTINSSGSMIVLYSGFASDTDIVGGIQTIFSSGSAENVKIYSSGKQYVSFSQVRHTTIYDGGRQIISSDGLSEDVTVQSAGTLLVNDFGKAVDITVAQNGLAYVLTLAEAQDIVVQAGGTLWVGMAGFAENITIQGAVHVATGGEVKDVSIADEGALYLYGGAILDGLINIRGTIVLDDTVQNNGTLNFMVGGEGNQSSDKAMLNDLSLLNGKNMSVTVDVASYDNGSYVLTGGGTDYAESLTVYDNLGEEICQLRAGDSYQDERFSYSLAITESNELMFAFSTGENVKLYDDDKLTSAAANMAGKVLTAGGDNRMVISSGGVATATILNTDTRMVVSCGGSAVDTIVNGGAFMQLENEAILAGTTELTGTLLISSESRIESEDVIINLIIDGKPSSQNWGTITSLNSLPNISLGISVTDNATAGVYYLAGNAKDYISSINLTVGNDEATESFIWDSDNLSYSPITINNTTYTLSSHSSNDTDLYLTIIDSISNAGYEYIARKLAYKDGHKRYKIGDIVSFSIKVDNKIENYYFKVIRIVDHLDGMDAILLERIDESNNSLHQAVLAFGGTEQLVLDGISDVLDAGVGYDQFRNSYKEIYKACNELLSQGCSLNMTGHSLGGALAQWFAAYSKQFGNIEQIDSVKTFNSPGISYKVNGNDIPTNASINTINHYVNDGDLVSMAGEYYLSNAINASYTLFATPFICSGNPFSYCAKAQHANTLFFLDELEKVDGTKLFKSSDLLEVVSEAPISSLLDGCFSYLTFSIDNDNVIKNLKDVFEIIPNHDNGYYLFNKQFAKVIDIVANGNIDFANQLVDRARTEKSRKDTGDTALKLLCNMRYLSFLGDTRIVEIGNEDLVSSHGRIEDKEIQEIIRTVTFLWDEQPEFPKYLFDFTNGKFIPLYHVPVQYLLNLQTEEISKQEILKIKMEIENKEETWICFMIPALNYISERYKIIHILNEAGRHVSPSNIIDIGDITYVLDDPSTTYELQFYVDKSITSERAGILPNIPYIDKDTTEFQLFVTDIDADETEFITVGLRNSLDQEETYFELQKTGVEGVFTEILDIVGENGFNVLPGENLIISYIDNNNGNGQQETITTEIPVLQTDAIVSIDETGLDADYTVITEDTAWYKFNVVVDSNTLAGTYVLAENMEGAQGNCVIWGSDSLTSEALTDDVNVRIDANTYSKQIINDKLLLTVKTAPRSIRWEEVDNAMGYVLELSQDQFESVIQLQYDGQEHTQVDLLNLPNGEYSYRVRAFENYEDLVISGPVVVFEDDDWTFGGTIVVKNNVVSEQRVSDEDDRGDFFFANVRGVWDDKFHARHFGVGEWEGTGEKVALTGKNKITDIFQGSNDDSALLLTDDENGDALFLDDIYSAFPEGLDAQSRIALIGEIAGGAGDDIIDLTSQRFDYIGGGMTVHGGLGDDVIWANTICDDHIIWADQRYNWLFGDAGDDRIVGAGSNDVIAGGIGNDSMHGGGGDDIFTFGGNWGNDIVEQLPDGKVTLWFEDGDLSKWDANTLTYTDGSNSVKVNGVGLDNISLKFSYGDMHPELAFWDGVVQYGYLAGIGAFDDYGAEKIFEDRNRGMLA